MRAPPKLSKVGIIKMMFRKILAIQFKYLGDSVFITPALMALRAQHPDAEIHLLVAQEVAPLFVHSTWITKVWAVPRTRGRTRVSESWPFIQAMRRERFDLSVDFAGNDRGGIMSFLIGAQCRLAEVDHKPTLLQRLAYTITVQVSALPVSWIKRHLRMLELALQTQTPESPQMRIAADPALIGHALDLLQGHTIICHIGTSQPKKEWPTQKWIELYRLAHQAGHTLAFSAGPNDREQALLTKLKAIDQDIFILPPVTDLSLYLAILSQTSLVISGDTGPLHFAAGLGINVIGLFGTADSVRYAAPIYLDHEFVMGAPCTCTKEKAKLVTCQSLLSCMDSISAERVFALVRRYAELGKL
jgi:ADP-heptose:LPS heptosyltransferase